MTDDDTPQSADATVSLTAAVTKAVPALTKREVRDVTAAVLRALSELIDEDTTDEGWPDADDLLMLADSIEGA